MGKVLLPLKHSRHVCSLITDSLLSLEKASLWGLCVLPRWVPGRLPALGMVLHTQEVLNSPSWCQERASLPAQTVLVLLKLFCGRWFVSWGNPCYLNPFFLLFILGLAGRVINFYFFLFFCLKCTKCSSSGMESKVVSGKGSKLNLPQMIKLKVCFLSSFPLSSFLPMKIIFNISFKIYIQ